jgi:prepilin-type N-terminal cleavage/methylation domain-containing protein
MVRLPQNNTARSLPPLARRAGFTLIELLIVVTISAFLSGIVILYSSVGRNQVSLSVQSTKVAQLLSRARALAVSTYANPGGTHLCAFGIVFDPSSNQYSLVGYEGPSGSASCPSASTVLANGVTVGDLTQYTPATWQVSLAAGVKFNPVYTTAPLSLVLYYPPDPTALLSTTACLTSDPTCTYNFGNQSGNIYLVTSDNSASTVITVGFGGQISW